MRLPVSSRDAVALLALVGGGAAFAAAERAQKVDVLDGLWWAFATVTTVGYGDIAPTTRAGRLIAAALMLEQALISRREAAEDHRQVRERLDEIVRRLDALEQARA
jgi:voltage-gated potassium channel Kch